MVNVVFIARKTDGLIFCEISEDCAHDKNLNSLKNRAIDLLKVMQNSDQELSTVNIDSQNYLFHYKIFENIVYLVICETKYPKQLAFSFLDEIHQSFMQELKNLFGTQSVSYYSKLETIEKAYHFAKFERTLKKIKQEYMDSSSNTYIEKLNKEILDVHLIMNENINLILDREKSLNSVNNMANTVKQESELFKKRAYETRMKLLFSKYSILIALAAIFILFIVFKIYF